MRPRFIGCPSSSLYSLFDVVRGQGVVHNKGDISLVESPPAIFPDDKV